MKSKVLKPEQHYINEGPCHQPTGEDARDYLSHMYAAANYTAVNDVASLSIKVSDIYRRQTPLA